MAVKRREQALQDYRRLQAKVEKYEEKEKTGPVLAKLHQVLRAGSWQVVSGRRDRVDRRAITASSPLTWVPAGPKNQLSPLPLVHLHPDTKVLSPGPRRTTTCAGGL